MTDRQRNVGAAGCWLLIAAAVAAVALAPAPGNYPESLDSSTPAPQLVCVTPEGAKYHREDCRTLARSPRVLRVPLSEVGGREPCRVCRPENEAAPR